jgi:hypothetical protein
MPARAFLGDGNTAARTKEETMTKKHATIADRPEAALQKARTIRSRSSHTGESATHLLSRKSPGAVSRSRGASSDSRANPNAQESKLDIIVAMMRSKGGATMDQLVKATGWQKHSLRGAISGNVKKRLRLKVSSERAERGRVYRIVR